MSNHDNEYKGSTFWQLILVIPGSILAFTLIISLIAKAYGVKPDDAIAEPAAAVAQVEENIAPVAEVAVAAVDAAPAAAKTGEQVYNSVCMMCHASGMMESPKFGDSGAWASRISKGYDTLVHNAINGVNMMPAKGGNPGLSDEEVANAVKYMANAGGASFE
jgi:cytochrome c5